MAVNTCEMWSTRIKIAFFPKTYKNRPVAGLQKPPIATGRWGLLPHTPICDTFEYISLFNTSAKLDICTF